MPANAQLQRLDRALRLRDACSRASVHAQSEAALLNEICRAIVELAGYPMAWVGYAEQDERKSVRPMAYFGSGDAYPEADRLTWADTDRGWEPAGTAIRTRARVLVQDIRTEPTMQPWRAAAARRGYAGCMALPLGENGEIFGALTVYATAENAFTDEEAELLAWVAEQVSFGVHALRLRAEHERLRVAFRRRGEKYRGFAEHLREGIWAIDAEGRTTFVNAPMARMLGYTAQEMLARPIFDFVDGRLADRLRNRLGRREPVAREPCELEFRHKSGKAVILDLQAWPRCDESGKLEGTVVGALDVTERKHQEGRLRQLASRDPLTELPLREVLEDRIAQALLHLERTPGEVFAVICIGIDHFKSVNESYGHPFGDALLKAVARVLEAAVRESDTLARQGGDEFIILLRNIETADNVLVVAEKIGKALDRPLVVRGRKLRVTCSIGASLCPADGTRAEALIENANAAMYRAQRAGGGIQFYTRALGEQAEERAKLAAQLRCALENGEFKLHYQPQVAFADGRVVGAEALIRWKRGAEGFVSPDRFVGVAEDIGLIGSIDEWVVAEACEQARRWSAAGLPGIRVAVNVAASQFHSGRIEDVVAALASRSALGTVQLELEISERIVMTDAQDTSERLGRLKRLGAQISIHNFGIGYSSLASLRRLPIDRIKIDQSFVRDLTASSAAEALVRSIIGLCHAFGFTVLAEGVETERQALMLARHGCDECQGYYVGGPMPAERFEGLLRDRGFALPATTA
ncbi:MAG: EAL domain-containing protein [Betaproteobacteria bacterium]|nr:EAL domain-containing protein [Betaproteobacteria bacterium]